MMMLVMIVMAMVDGGAQALMMTMVIMGQVYPPFQEFLGKCSKTRVTENFCSGEVGTSLFR